MVNESHLIIGIYGIQDINKTDIPTISHDHGICVMENGKVLFNIQLERLDRNKHSNAMPKLIYDLLKQKKLLNKEYQFVFVDNVLGRSFINDIGNIRFEAPINNSLKNQCEEGNLWWLDKSKKAYVLNHELAHIGSCLPFFGSFKNNSLLVHFDGGASQSNFSAWHYLNGEIKPIEHHWRLKKLSSLFNANALSFAMVKAKAIDQNSVPGKLMGFASFGNYKAEIEQWLEEHNYFENIWGSKSSFYNAVKTKFNIELTEIDQKNTLIQDIAATIHSIFVRETFNELQKLQKLSKTDYLYYSGGSALNIVLNTKLVESGIFNDVFIPPCCNDSGLAIGAAAFYNWQKHNNTKVESAFLNNWNIENYRANYTHNTINEVAELLVQNKVIGICNNAAEVGPRALGNRSIISLASSKKLADKVSMIHKKREWYRPVAPIMLEQNSKYFTKLKSIHHLSKYMLIDFNIPENKRKELEGAVHIDGTSRIQTLFSKEDNPFMYDLLLHLNNKYNIKALINTSFNIKGEPIVHTINDALQSATNMKLDAVVLNGELKYLM